MLSAERLTDALVVEADRVAELARDADLEQQVPTCPGWDLRRLLGHIGGAHRFGADVVRRRVREPAQLSDASAIPVPEQASEMPGWLREGARELVDAVASVGAEAPVWNFSGEHQQAGFWLRHMTHETTVHRGDLALSVGAPYELEAEVAADGISKWLALVTSPRLAAAFPEVAAALRGRDQTLHLHATDSPELGAAGEWLIVRGPEALSWRHEHLKADVAVRGPAGWLLLALLGRIPPGDERIEVLGDATLFEHWQQHAAIGGPPLR